MSRILHVHFLPELADPHELAGHATVVIDVLRASTTIVHALTAGAAEVVPCLEVAEARQLAQQRPGALLGGERGGKRISGFDFGNSPTEYTSSAVAQKTIVFTTTNGTRALHACIGSAEVLIGAFVNLRATCEQVWDLPRVDLLCAGTGGRISADDCLVAGAMVDHLLQESPGADDEYQINDQAQMAQMAWQQVCGGTMPAGLDQALAETQAGRNLIGIGQADDLRIAASLNRFQTVPRLDRSSWRITAS